MAVKLDPDVQFVNLWAKALDKYKDQTGRDLAADPSARDIKTLKDLDKKITQSNQQFSEFRQRDAGLRKGILTAFSPILVVGGIAQNVLGGAQILPASAALGAILHLVNSAKGVSEAYDAVEDLLARIAAATQRFEHYSEGAINDELGRLVTETMCIILAILARTEKLARRSRAQEYLRIALLGKDEKLQSLFKDLERLSSDEAKLVTALSYMSIQRTVEGTMRTEKGIEAISAQIGQATRKNDSMIDRQQMNAILNEALSDRMCEIYRSIGRDRIQATGDWIFDDTLMKQWFESKLGFLWILGVGGVGKSFLSTRIIDELERRKAPTQSVAYFFVKNDNTSTCSIANLLKCVALQLADQNSEYESFAAVVCRNQKRIRSADDSWKNLFEDYFSVDRYYGSARIVIDGIDEAPQDQQKLLFHFIRKLQERRVRDKCRLQFLLLGRPNVTRQWPGSPPPEIEVSTTKMSEDVVRYIQENIKRVKLLRHKRKDERAALKSRIVERLQEGAAGMFLWAKLMLEEIVDQPRPSGIEQALASPPSLYQLLETIIERLVKNARSGGNDLRDILIWSTFATRELYLGEIKLLLELKEPIGEGLPGLESYLREDYRSLFVLDRQDGKTTEDLRRVAVPDAMTGADELQAASDEETNMSPTTSDEEPTDRRVFDSELWTTKVSISHNIIREYIRSTKSPVIGISPMEAHERIAITCLRSLADRLPSLNGRTLRDQKRLQEYSASSYLFHIGQLESSKMSENEIEIVASLLSFVLYNLDSIARIIELREDGDKFLATYFSTQVTLNIQQWIARAPKHDMNQGVAEWRSSSQLLRSSLLRPMAIAIARTWLQNKPSQADRFYINFYIVFLHAYQHLLDTPQLASIERIENYAESISVFDVDRLNYEDICASAQCIELPRNSEWYSALGLALCWNGHDYHAVHFLRKAIELEKNNAVARYGLCNSYCPVEPAKSIEMGISYLALEPTETPLTTDCWVWMNAAVGNLDADEKSILDWARKNLGAHAGSVHGISFCLSTLWMQENYVELFSFVEQIQAREDPESKNSLLYESLPALAVDSILNIVATSVELGGQRPRALEIADNLAHVAESAKDFDRKRIARYFQGLIHLVARPTSQDVVKIFEEIRSNLNKTDRDIRGLNFLYQMDARLSSIYFEQAMAATKNGKETFSVKKLEELDRRPSSSLARHPIKEDYIDLPVKKALALWYRLDGKNELCKKLLQANFQEGIQILRDSDVQNDAQGYEILTSVLLRIGNFVQAIAAFTPLLLPISRRQARYISLERTQNPSRVVQRRQQSQEENVSEQAAISDEGFYESLATEKPEIQQTESGYEAENSHRDPSLSPHEKAKARLGGLAPIARIDNDYTLIECHAGCLRRIVDELWLCEYCNILTVFCGECLQRYKRGHFRILGSRCQRYHPYHRVYPIDEDLKNRATKNIQGRTLPRKEWLEELEETWMTPSSSGREYGTV